MKKTVEPIVQHPHNLRQGVIEGAPDAFSVIDEALGAYRIGESFIANDGFIGMDVTLTVYNDASVIRSSLARAGRLDDDCEPHNANHPREAREVCLYLIHTALKRVGQERDEVILRDLLARGLAVVVVDYHHDIRADVPDLDWSVQSLIEKMNKGEIALPVRFVPSHFISLPAGYTARVGIPFYNYEKNGVDGILDYIVDIWNNSLSRMSGRFAKGNVFKVKWGQKCDLQGNPVFDEEGNPVYKKVREGAVWTDEAERILPVGYTIAEDISDCVRTDGSPVDLNLYLDLVYPAKPSAPVPIFAHHSSAEERFQPQPIYHGCAMRGYACFNFEHAYTPMARRTHFGYFEGEIADGRRADFTLRFVTGMSQMTAAVRLVRKLVELYPEEYQFIPDKMGCYGGSKGAPTNILGTAHPELLPPEDFLPGRWGENSNPQPFTHYENGTEIPSGIQFAYASSGGGGTFLFKDQCPLCVTRGESDGAFVSGSHMGMITSSLRYNDTPALDMSMPGVGHKTIHGYSEARDYDMYNALFTFSAYYLKDAPSECLWILPVDKSDEVDVNAVIRMKFSGEHTEEEIRKNVRLVHEDGTPLRVRIRSFFRGNEWTFTPLDLYGGETVRAQVLPTLRDKRGNLIGKVRSVTFKTRGNGTINPVKTEYARDAIYVTFQVGNRNNCKLSFASSDETQKGVRYTVSDAKMPHSSCVVAPVDGVCLFEIPQKWIGDDGECTIRIAPKKAKKKTIAHFPFKDASEPSPFTSPVGGYAEPVRILPKGEMKMARCSEMAMVLSTGSRVTLDDFLPVRSRSDVGRTFRISFDCRCENDRMLQARAIERRESEDYFDFFNEASLLEPMSADHWTRYSYEYTVNSLDSVDRAHRKNSLIWLATSNGIAREEFCLRDVLIEEIQEKGEVLVDTICITY